jgi:hypothetical protein
MDQRESSVLGKMTASISFDSDSKFNTDKIQSDVILNEQRYQVTVDECRRSEKYTHMVTLEHLKSQLKEEFEKLKSDDKLWNERIIKIHTKADSQPQSQASAPQPDNVDQIEADGYIEVEMVMMIKEEKNNDSKFSSLDPSQVMDIPYLIIASKKDEDELLGDIKKSVKIQNSLVKTLNESIDTLDKQIEAKAKELVPDYKIQKSKASLSEEEETRAVKDLKDMIKDQMIIGLRKLEDDMKKKLEEFNERIEEYKKIELQIKNAGFEQRKKTNQMINSQKFLDEMTYYKKNFETIDEKYKSKKSADNKIINDFTSKLAIYNLDKIEKYRKIFWEKKPSNPQP